MIKNKICISCNVDITYKWYAGPKCNRCYRTTLYASRGYVYADPESRKQYLKEYSQRPEAHRSNNIRQTEFRKTEKGIKYAKDFHRKPETRLKRIFRHCQEKNWEFDLDLISYSKLIQLPCHYCSKKIEETGHGLDRTDNNKGYLLTNVVPCCDNCNTMKNDFLTYEEMVFISKALKKFRASGGVDITGLEYCKKE